MTDFGKKVQSDNAHLSNGTGAKFVHVDGSLPQVVVRPTKGRLLRVVIGTAGVVCIIRDGSRVISLVSATAIGTLNFGVYVSNNITVDISSGTGSITFVHEQ